MLRNYLLVSVRNLLRHKTFSFINVFGLAISMAVCLLILTIMVDLFSYDRFHEHKDRIYRVTSQRAMSELSSSPHATSPVPMKEALLESYPGIEKAVRFRQGFEGDAKTSEKILPLSGLYTDPEVFDVMSFEWIAGNPATALSNPNQIVLTAKSADRLFGSRDILGELITVGKYGEFIVSGVLEDVPKRSHLQFQSLVSFSTLEALSKSGVISPYYAAWNNLNNAYLYLLLKPEADVQNVQNALDEIAEANRSTEDQFFTTYHLQAFNKITPGNSLSNEMGPVMPILILWLLAFLAGVIMLSACFNYTNLSLARSLTRMKEIGIRKVSGAFRGQIIHQFLTEALLMSLLALGIAFVLLEWLVPAFESLHPEVGEVINLDRTPEMYAVFFVFSVLVGLFAGFIPAIQLSKYKPVIILKGISGIKLSGKMPMRKVLIVAQFTFSLIFIISAIVIGRQLNHIMDMDMGFRPDQIINVELQGNEFSRVQQAFEAVPGVRMVSGSSDAMVVGSVYTQDFKHKPTQDSADLAFLYVDQGFMQNVQMELISGTSFPDHASDSNEQYIVVNEKAVARFGLGNAEEAIGKVLIQGGETPLKVIGVTRDFLFNDFKSPITHFGFRYAPSRFRYANVKIEAGNHKAMIGSLKSAWKDIDKLHPFTFKYFDDQVADSMADLKVVGKIIGFISFLAIIIASLGLLGMAAYSSETRTREVGIRKVLGAEVGEILFLLSKGFLTLLGMAIAIAAPTAYFLNQMWLEFFAYRIEVGFGSIFAGIMVLLGLGMLAIGSQTFRAARANPVEALRSE